MKAVFKKIVVLVVISVFILASATTAFAKEAPAAPVLENPPTDYVSEFTGEFAPDSEAEYASLDSLDLSVFDQALTETNEAYGTEALSPVQQFVSRLYKICLGRNVGTDEMQAWVDLLESKKSTGAEVAAGFVNSQEFLSMNLSDENYVLSLYAAFFNRIPDEDGYVAWVTGLKRGYTRNTVLGGFLNSQEFKALCQSYGIDSGEYVLTKPVDTAPEVTAFVTRLYGLCLGRTADYEGLSSWVELLVNKSITGTDAAAGFLFSDEFLNKMYVNTDFVEIMYVVFFDRYADSDGHAAWVKLLDEGYQRNDVFAGFANSNEFTEVCRKFGIERGVAATLPPYALPGRPAKPSIVISSKNGNAVIDITGPSDCLYEIWWVYEGNYAKIIGTTTSSNRMQYVDTDVEAGRTYKYYVKAVKVYSKTQMTRSEASNLAAVTI